ncbi:MAG: T9SS type A sorting domain-containing protein [Candidatus Marinimicrobia bacterium]|nr:T9SS type A sorting domain-containing protein [Candidatus Neomarinimicrobiota bacterium]
MMVLLVLPAYGLDLTYASLLKLSQNWQTGHVDIYPENITALENIQMLEDGGEAVAAIVFPAEGGYLVFSTSVLTKPLIAVSTQRTAQTFSPDHPLVRLVKFDLSNRKYRASRSVEEQIQNREAWNALSLQELPETVRRDSIIFNESPVWGQGWAAGAMVFNLYTPSNHPTGCVATALAEVLTYYHWPPRGTGSNSYLDDGINHYVDFSQFEYDWQNTLDNYVDEFSTPVQKQAAGLLSYHAAVSVGMDFEVDGSTANTADGVTALHYHFRCSGHYLSSSSTGFYSQVIANLEDGRPVILALNSAVDHAGVADGYASQYGLVHMNFGWNGNSNGWYDIESAFLPGYDYTIIGGLKGIIPNPMIEEDQIWEDADSFTLSWLTSFRLNAEYFELQQKVGSGNWVSLNAAIPDTSYAIDVDGPGTYSYRVRPYRDGTWWDWSRTEIVSVGEDVTVQFIIDLQDRPLDEGESLVLLGNIEPLGNIQNSPEFDYEGVGIYTTEVTFENSHVSELLAYRFGVVGSDYQDIETFNREYLISAVTYQTLDTVRFNLPVAIESEAEIHSPGTFQVEAAYPNPFNHRLTVPVLINEPENIQIDVFDISGKRIQSLNEGILGEGKHLINLDFESALHGSGIYFIRVNGNHVTQIIKCQLLK